MNFKRYIAIVTAVAATVIMGSTVLNVPLAHARGIEQCVRGSGSESGYQFCAESSWDGGYYQSNTHPDRITCTVTVWQYYIGGPGGPAQYVTYTQGHYVGGVTGFIVTVGGDGDWHHYLEGLFYQRCDGSYAFQGWFSFSP